MGTHDEESRRTRDPATLFTGRDGQRSLSAGGVFGLWSYTDFADPRWVLGTRFIQLRQLPAHPGRFQEQMGGISNSSGWGAYYRNEHLFLKRAPVIHEAQHNDFGCNFEVFTNADFLELETLGPMVELQPGEAVEHVEHWWSFGNVPGGENDAWIDAAVVPVVEQLFDEGMRVS